MIYTGQSAIDYLATKINETDPVASSHWQIFIRPLIIQVMDSRGWMASVDVGPHP